MICIVGSEALKIRAPKLLTREPLDIDYIASFQDVQDFIKKEKNELKSYEPFSNGNKYKLVRKDGKIIEMEIAWEGSTGAELIELVKNDPETIIVNNYLLIPSLDALFAIKSSHRYKKNSFHTIKTVHDYHALKGIGCKITDYYKSWYKRREKETYTVDKLPKLNVNKNAFFSGNGIEQIFDHDSIHDAVARLDKPAYKYYQPEDEEVNTSKAMFYACSEEVRLNGVCEEITVLALERSQIPFKDKSPDPRWSWEKALSKVITSITSGYFREYAYENYFKVLKMYDPLYVNKFWQKVADGKVKLFVNEH